jgi:hypothetical protein
MSCSGVRVVVRSWLRIRSMPTMSAGAATATVPAREHDVDHGSTDAEVFETLDELGA